MCELAVAASIAYGHEPDDPICTPILGRELNAPVEERIETALVESVRTPDPYLNEIAAHLIIAGGTEQPLRAAVSAAPRQAGEPDSTA